MKRTITLIISIASLGMAYSQDHPVFSQHSNYKLMTNPAYTGKEETLNIAGLFRNQWTNIDGAPETMVFSIDGKVKGEKSGLGLIIVNDKIGITSRTDVRFSYGYHLRKTYSEYGKYKQLSFGMQGGVSFYQEKLTELGITNDPAFQSNIHETVFVFGAGLVYETNNYFVSISIPQLASRYDFVSTSKILDNEVPVMLAAGYKFELNHQVEVKPQVMLNKKAGSKAGFDVSSGFRFQDKIELGIGYRSTQSANIALSFNLKQWLEFGYVYDTPINTSSSLKMGSHEISFKYKIAPKRLKSTPTGL